MLVFYLHNLLRRILVKNQKWKFDLVMVKENLVYLEYFLRNVVDVRNVAFV